MTSDTQPSATATKGSSGAADGGVSDRASAAGDQARAERDRLVGEVDTHARRLVGEGREQLASRVDGQLTSAAESLRDLGGELETMAGASDRRGLPKELAEMSADGLCSLADRLDEGGVRGALDDLRRFGRERPGAFVGMCFVAGAALGRVLRNTDNETLKDAATSDSDTEMSSRADDDRDRSPRGDVASGDGSPRVDDPGGAVGTPGPKR